MTCENSNTITEEKITGLNSDIQTIDTVVESTLPTTVTKDGKVINTLSGQLALLGFQPAIAYAMGISFAVSDTTKTVDEGGTIYAPRPSSLPFTTSGTFVGDDDDRFYVVQQVVQSELLILRKLLGDALSDPSIQIGNNVIINGRTVEGDGGENIYLVVAPGTGTDDGGSYINDTIDGTTFQLKGLFPAGKINTEQFGAPGSPSEASSEIQSAMDAAAALGISRVVCTRPLYQLTATLTVPGAVTLDSQATGGSVLRYFADVVGVVMGGPVGGLGNRIRFELDPSVVSRTENCVEVGTMAIKSNSCKIDCNIVGWGDIQAQTGDGVYIKNANFTEMGSCNIESIGRDGLHVSNDTGDTNTGTIGNTYVNVCGRDAYHFAADVSGWEGYPRCLRFQRYGIYYGGARFNRLFGDIESVGPQGQAWTFGPDVFEGYTDGVFADVGAYGNYSDVFPVASSSEADALATNSNEIIRRAGANEWRAYYGATHLAGQLWLDNNAYTGEMQISQTGNTEYSFNFGGTGGSSKLLFTNGGTQADIDFDARLNVAQDGVVQTPNVNADEVVIHNSLGNAGISIFGSAASFNSVRMGRAGQDSAGIFAYDNAVDSIKIFSNDVLGMEIDSSQNWLPGADNTQTIGSASFRMSEIFAANGSINTSDERMKSDFVPVDDRERRAAAEIRKSLGKYKWLASIKNKGDSARYHFGASAQEVGKIMKRNGLNPDEYALYCYDEWEGGNRYGLRYDQLALFLLSAL
jgi:hypothetical protein